MKGYVYAIRSHLSEKMYVGSTQSPLSVRMAGHRQDYKRFQAGKFNFVSSFDILAFGDAYIEALEVVEFNDKVELIARENHFIRTLDCVNRRVEGRTHQEYRAEHLVEKAKYNKIYSTKNAEELKAKQSKILTCECGSECCYGNMPRHRKSTKHIKAMSTA